MERRSRELFPHYQPYLDLDCRLKLGSLVGEGGNDGSLGQKILLEEVYLWLWGVRRPDRPGKEGSPISCSSLSLSLSLCLSLSFSPSSLSFSWHKSSARIQLAHHAPQLNSVRAPTLSLWAALQLLLLLWLEKVPVSPCQIYTACLSLIESDFSLCVSSTPLSQFPSFLCQVHYSAVGPTSLWAQESASLVGPRHSLLDLCGTIISKNPATSVKEWYPFGCSKQRF